MKHDKTYPMRIGDEGDLILYAEYVNKIRAKYFPYRMTCLPELFCGHWKICPFARTRLWA